MIAIGGRIFFITRDKFGLLTTCLFHMGVDLGIVAMAIYKIPLNEEWYVLHFYWIKRINIDINNQFKNCLIKNSLYHLMHSILDLHNNYCLKDFVTKNQIS